LRHHTPLQARPVQAFLRGDFSAPSPALPPELHRPTTGSYARGSPWCPRLQSSSAKIGDSSSGQLLPGPAEPYLTEHTRELGPTGRTVDKAKIAGSRRASIPRTQDCFTQKSGLDTNLTALRVTPNPHPTSRPACSSPTPSDHSRCTKTYRCRSAAGTCSQPFAA
jgi:hypothetical protein